MHKHYIDNILTRIYILHTVPFHYSFFPPLGRVG